MRSIGVALASLTLLLAVGPDPARSGGGPPSPGCKPTNGPDRLVLSAGADACAGLRGNDSIFGRGGADRLDGNAGADKLFGGSGNDSLRGDTGADQLSGEAGSDRLDDSSRQTDRALGGTGNDRIDLRDNVTSNDSVNGGRGTDVCLVDRGDRVRECETVIARTPVKRPPPKPPGSSTRTKLSFVDIAQDKEPVRFGDRLTYTVQVRNIGTVTAKTVRLAAGRQSPFLKPYVVFDAPGTCKFGKDTAHSPTADCPMGDIAKGATKTFVLSGIVDAEFRDEVQIESMKIQFIASATNADAVIGEKQNLVNNR